MTSPASESVVPKNSVAFDIPLEKKNDNNSSPNHIQKRLAQAVTPTKETTLKSIENKLSEANKRKANGTTAKTASHNEKVQNVREKVNQIETEKKKQVSRISL